MLIAPHGLIGNRIPGKPGIWEPGQIYFDLADEHSKVIDGAILEALREIEGEIPGNEEMQQLSKILHDPGYHCLVTIFWKEKPILEVYQPEVVRPGVIKHRIKQVWKQSHDHFKG